MSETVKEIFEELLDAWETSEEAVIWEWGCGDRDMEQMTEKSREYRARFNKAYKRLINTDTGWSGPAWR